MRKQETMGSRIGEARRKAGLSFAGVQKRIFELYRAEIGETTIRNIEQNVAPNPGIKTVEMICLGLGLPPLEVIALHLDDPPDSSDEFLKSKFALLWKEYEKKPPAKRQQADVLLDMVIDRIKRL